MSSIIRATTTSGLQIAPDNSGSLILQTNGTTAAVTVDTSQNTTFAGKVTSAGALTLASNGTTTAVTIDTSQNVGIGITNPSYKTVISNSGAEGFEIGTGYSSGKNLFQSYNRSGSSYVQADNVASVHTWQISGSEKMRIDSSGNVGIGTASPSSKLHIVSASAQSFYLGYNSSLVSYLGTRSDGAFQLYSYNSGTTAYQKMYLSVDGTNAGGEVLVCGATDNGAYNLQCNGTGVWGAGAYVNGSDERIKEDIAPIQSGLDVVEKLNPVTYRYKEDWSKDQSTQTGFIAQELLTALEGKNYVDGVVQQGGSKNYYSVAYQNIIPILTKAIQEQQTIINDLKARVTVLEAK
jgi:hypothetical protein